MDREKMQILIDTLKRLSVAPLPEYPNKGFNMETAIFDMNESVKCVKHSCGTAACIIGWAELVIGCVSKLKLDGVQYIKLFMPTQVHDCTYCFAHNPEIFTIEAAVTVLERLLETGKVDWNYAIDNPWQGNDAPAKPTVLDMLMMESVDLPEGPKRDVAEDNLTRAKAAGLGVKR